MIVKPPADEEQFISALTGEDELGVVVRAHIYVEATLIELVEALAINPQHLKPMELDYFQRVNLAIVLGLNPEHGPPLLALGKLRNAFAHRIDTRLTKDRVENLYKALSQNDKELVQKMYEKTNTMLLKERGPRFRSLEPKDQFILIAVALRYMLVAANHIMKADPGAA